METMSAPFDPRLLMRFGAGPEDAAARLEQELEAFTALLPLLKPHWTARPAADAWCPAQVVEHVIKVNDATSKILHLLNRQAPLPEVARRPGELANGKPQAPIQLKPGEPRPFAELTAAWQVSTARFLAEVASTRDWTERRFFHPFFGDLSAQAWVQAMSFHNAHHRKGLERAFLGTASDA